MLIARTVAAVTEARQCW